MNTPQDYEEAVQMWETEQIVSESGNVQRRLSSMRAGKDSRQLF